MRAWFAQSDDYGFALVLILATVIVLATIGSAPAGQFVAVALSGGTLMFVLHTSRARPGVFRFAAAVVIGGIVISGIALLLGLGAWGRGSPGSSASCLPSSPRWRSPAASSCRERSRSRRSSARSASTC